MSSLNNREQRMSDVNKIIITGRVTKNPEFRKTPTGVVLDFYIACNKNYPRHSTKTWKQETVFIKITQWNKNAEYWKDKLKISDEVFVVGELVTDDYIQKDGKPTHGRIKIDRADVQRLRDSNYSEAE